MKYLLFYIVELPGSVSLISYVATELKKKLISAIQAASSILTNRLAVLRNILHQHSPTVEK